MPLICVCIGRCRFHQHRCASRGEIIPITVSSAVQKSEGRIRLRGGSPKKTGGLPQEEKRGKKKNPQRPVPLTGVPFRPPHARYTCDSHLSYIYIYMYSYIERLRVKRLVCSDTLCTVELSRPLEMFRDIEELQKTTPYRKYVTRPMCVHKHVRR